MDNESVKLKMIRRLQEIASEYDAWWTTPKGEAVQICPGGLFSPRIKKSVPWGDLAKDYPYVLADILKDNETHILKGELITRKEAGFPVKRTKYVPRHMGKVSEPPEPPFPRATKEDWQDVKWEEIPPALPEPPPPFEGEDVPF